MAWGTSAAVLEAQVGAIVSSLEAEGHELVFLDDLRHCTTDHGYRLRPTDTKPN